MPISLPSRYTPTGTVFPGGQGEVHACHDNVLQRSVAVKILHNVRDRHSLQNELRALSAVRSKHVVQPFDLVTLANSQLALVEEYVPGQDLDGYTAANISDYLKLLFQISSGLCDIHRAGLIHRDVKPRNMKFDDEQIVKLFDLTLSCRVDDAETNALRGTNYFRAPEFFGTPPINLTPAVDMYALGVSAWKLSRGDLPWQLRAMPTTSRPDSFGTHPLAIPFEITLALDSCLDANPSSRPSAATLQALLRKHILAGKHNGRLVHGSRTATINSSTRSVRVNAAPLATFTLEYNDLDFLITVFSGDIFVNGIAISQNYVLPESCVISLGAEVLGARRQHLTFDVSHPEVIV